MGNFSCSLAAFESSLRHASNAPSLALELLLNQAHGEPVQEVNLLFRELKSIKYLTDH